MHEIYLQYIAQQTAAPASAPEAGGGSTSPFMQNLSTPVLIFLIFAFTWFFLIRPQQKEEKKKKEMLSTLKKGDPVVTHSGILGTVVSIKESTIILNVGDGTKMEFLRSAVSAVREKGDKGESPKKTKG